MTPKRQVIEALKDQLADLVPTHGRHLDVTLPNQALRAESQTPYINISAGRDDIQTPAPRSRDHRVQVSVARVSRIKNASEIENDAFELDVFGYIDDNPTLNGLVHRCRPVGVQPTQVDEQLVAHEIMLEVHFSVKINS